MAVFLDWKSLDKAQVLSLESENDPANIKSMLESYMKVKFKDSRKRDIAVDFHFYNYTFCKDQAFNDRQTSTFMSIMLETFNLDISEFSPAHSRTHSFQNFQRLILKHSIERSPISIEVFSESDVTAIIEHVISRIRLMLTQGLPNEVEKPSLAILPLNSAYELHVHVPVPVEVHTEVEKDESAAQ